MKSIKQDVVRNINAQKTHIIFWDVVSVTIITALAIYSISLSLSGREVFYALFFGTLGAWFFL